MRPTLVMGGEQLSAYGWPGSHPFGLDRHGAFEDALAKLDLRDGLVRETGRMATLKELGRFHSRPYLQFVRDRCEEDQGYLDGGDTPAGRGLTKPPGMWPGRRSMLLNASWRAGPATLSCRSADCIMPAGSTLPDFACSTTSGGHRNPARGIWIATHRLRGYRCASRRRRLLCLRGRPGPLFCGYPRGRPVAIPGNRWRT